MANLKFSEFTEQTDPANVAFVVGYDGATNVRIDPANIGGGGGAGLFEENAKRGIWLYNIHRWWV